MRYLLLSLLFVASLCRADTFTPVPSKIVGPGGSKISIEGGNATIQPSSGGAVNVVTGAVYVPTVLDFSTSVSPLVSASGHSSLAFNGTNLVLSLNGGGYITLGGTAWGGITGDPADQTDLAALFAGKVATTRTVNGHALSANVSVTASDLSLGSVENTALSTWAGSTNLTTLGTIGTGTWNATAIADGKVASALTGKTYNGLTITSSTGTLTIAAAKTATVNNTLTLAGTDSTTMTFPGTSATIARTDAAQAFTGTQTFSGTIDVPTLTSASSITGGAGNMTITSGTGNSRTMILKTTTSGGTATTALTLGADQSATFAAGATFNGNVGLPSGTGTLTAGVLTANGTGGVKIISGSLGCNIWPASGDTLEIVNRAEGGDGNLQCFNLRPFGDVVCGTAGKGLQLKSGTGARAGNATLVGGTVTVTNTTVTANSIIYCGRKTAGGTLGQSLSYTLSAGTSFTITSVDATGVLSALDTSVVSFIIVELN